MARTVVGFCLVALLAPAGCGPSPGDRAADVMVYAAASLTDVLPEVGARFQATEGLRVSYSFAGSSTLARQILRGAPADVFVSASPDWVDTVEQEGGLEPGTRRDVLANELVLVAAPGGRRDPVRLDELPAVLGEARLALADPEAAPAGIYAREALTGLGLWEGLEDRLAVAGDVRAALTLVERGECPLGIVYRTDAAAAGVPVVATFPAELTGPVVYTAAAVAGRVTPAVRAYLDALVSPGARRIFASHGFRSPELPR